MAEEKCLQPAEITDPDDDDKPLSARQGPASMKEDSAQGTAHSSAI